MGKPLFISIINNFIDFYSGAMTGSTNTQVPIAQNNSIMTKYIRNPNSNPMHENIRQTFYDTMMHAIQIEQEIMPPADVIEFAPYVCIGMPALSIIYNILESLNTNGIKLISGDIITKNNCPMHNALFEKLFAIKQVFVNKKFSDIEIQLIKWKCVNNPEMQIPNVLEQKNSPFIMKLVADITEISLVIGQMYNFQQHMAKLVT